MKDRILIVGTGGAGLAQKALYDLGHENVTIVSPEEARQEAFPKSEPFIIQAPPPLREIYGGKQFVCKGRHEYRQVKTTTNNVTSISWVCECGRKL